MLASISKKKKDSEIKFDKTNLLMKTVAERASFYRANPHRFCRDYLNVNLKIFQQIILVMMFINNYTMMLAARGIGKSWLVAVFICCYSILYPETHIIIAAGKRAQSLVVLEKIINELMPKSNNLKMEIKEYTINNLKAEIVFKNGSRVEIVTSNDNARGKRCNILIVDEFRMVKKAVIDTVLRKFATVPRSPNYLTKTKYKHLIERNKEIYLSSAWYQSHWSFDKAKTYCANLVNEKTKYFICGLPYQLSIREGLLNYNQVVDEMSETDFNEVSWSIEMGCLFYGDNDGSFFSYNDVSKNRNIKLPFYPLKTIEHINKKSKLKILDLRPNEKRILAVDVALIPSKKYDNDAASITLNCALPTSSNNYVSNIVYGEVFEGLHTNDLALIVRRYFNMFHCTDLAIDVKGLGIGVYDQLVREIYDAEYGITYPALSCCNNKIYAERCLDKNAKKVIWALQATSDFNSNMYLALREGFRQGKINLLISEFDTDEVLNDISGYKKLSIEHKTDFQLPYINTTLLINELIDLEYKVNGTNIKVSEKRGKRKDRVSSLGYSYYVQQELEKKLRKKKENTTEATIFAFRKPKLYSR